MSFHTIAGLPRAGSTLICNLLAQNPAFDVSSTSALAGTVAQCVTFWSNSPEIKSDLAHDREHTESRLRRTVRDIIRAWYPDGPGVSFDKGRGWIAQAPLLASVFPDARIITCVRDPRDVFASIQKHHLRFPILSEQHGETAFSRADRLFAPQGIVGGPMTHIEDHLRARTESIVPVVFERLVKRPERELRKVYAEIGQDWFDGHDFDRVEDHARDLDALYLDKFPHHTPTGPVAKPDTDWREHVPADIAGLIVQRYPGFAKAFGYG